MNIEDYRAEEKTFQILTQVAGRAGREKTPGKVIIQTYNPDNFSIECAEKQDYNIFYSTEIKLRKQLKYPPFCDIIVFGISGINEKNVENTSKEIYNSIVQRMQYKEGVDIFKPRPAPIDKIKNKYRYRIIIKANFDEEIIDIINEVLKETYTSNLKSRIVVDVNPTNML